MTERVGNCWTEGMAWKRGYGKRGGSEISCDVRIWRV
jgi:hypothetical protein